MVDIEPHHVIKRMAQVLPLMRQRLEQLISGPDSAERAATVVRVAVSQYLVRSDDSDDFLAQLKERFPDGLAPDGMVAMIAKAGGRSLRVG